MFKSNLVFVVVLVIESKGDVIGEGSQRRNDATTIFSVTQRYYSKTSVTIRNNVATMLQRGVALKIVV